MTFNLNFLTDLSKNLIKNKDKKIVTKKLMIKNTNVLLLPIKNPTKAATTVWNKYIGYDKSPKRVSSLLDFILYNEIISQDDNINEKYKP